MSRYDDNVCECGGTLGPVETTRTEGYMTQSATCDKCGRIAKLVYEMDPRKGIELVLRPATASDWREWRDGRIG